MNSLTTSLNDIPSGILDRLAVQIGTTIAGIYKIAIPFAEFVADGVGFGWVELLDAGFAFYWVGGYEGSAAAGGGAGMYVFCCVRGGFGVLVIVLRKDWGS